MFNTCFTDRVDKTENIESYLIRKYGSLHNAFVFCNAHDKDVTYSIEMFFRVLQCLVEMDEEDFNAVSTKSNGGKS